MAKLSPADIKKVKGMGFLHNRGTEDEFSARIITENGVVSATQLLRIKDLAEQFGSGSIAVTTRLTYEVPGIKFDKIPEVKPFLAQDGLATGGTGSRIRPVVACKGTVCQYGNADTQGIATKLHNDFYVEYYDVKLPHKFKFAVGGCPNNCVKPSLNDVGIVAVNTPNYEPDLCSSCKKCGVVESCPIGAVTFDGKVVIDAEKCNDCGRCIGKCHMDALETGTKGFKIYLGGRWGKQTQHGVPLAKIYSETELYEIVEMLVLLYREAGKTGERFGSTLSRVGMEFFESELATKDVLKRKTAILEAPLHLEGGATC